MRQQNNDKEDEEFLVKSKTLFQMLFLDEQRKLERALVTLTTISLKEGSPMLENYYDQKLIERLLKVID